MLVEKSRRLNFGNTGGGCKLHVKKLRRNINEKMLQKSMEITRHGHGGDHISTKNDTFGKETSETQKEEEGRYIEYTNREVGQNQNEHIRLVESSKWTGALLDSVKLYFGRFRWRNHYIGG